MIGWCWESTSYRKGRVWHQHPNMPMVTSPELTNQKEYIIPTFFIFLYMGPTPFFNKCFESWIFTKCSVTKHIILQQKKFNHPNLSLLFHTFFPNNRVFPKIVVPLNHFKRVFHYKPSILGYLYFWKHPIISQQRSNPVTAKPWSVSHQLSRSSPSEPSYDLRTGLALHGSHDPLGLVLYIFNAWKLFIFFSQTVERK